MSEASDAAAGRVAVVTGGPRGSDSASSVTAGRRSPRGAAPPGDAIETAAKELGVFTAEVDVSDRSAIDAAPTPCAPNWVRSRSWSPVRHRRQPAVRRDHPRGVGAHSPGEPHRHVPQHQSALPDMVTAGWGRIVTLSSSSDPVRARGPGALHRLQGRRDRHDNKRLSLRVRPVGHHGQHDPAVDHRHAMSRAGEVKDHIDRVAQMTPVRRLGTPEHRRHGRVPRLRCRQLHHRPADQRERRLVHVAIACGATAGPGATTPQTFRAACILLEAVGGDVVAPVVGVDHLSRGRRRTGRGDPAAAHHHVAGSNQFSGMPTARAAAVRRRTTPSSWAGPRPCARAASRKFCIAGNIDPRAALRCAREEVLGGEQHRGEVAALSWNSWVARSGPGLAVIVVGTRVAASCTPTRSRPRAMAAARPPRPVPPVSAGPRIARLEVCRPDGAHVAACRQRRRTSSGTGSSVNRRMARDVAITSHTSCGWPVLCSGTASGEASLTGARTRR